MRKERTPGPRLLEAYAALLEAYGPQGWWPSESSFETIVGAVLTQNTAWRNAERAIAALRTHGALTTEGMAALGRGRLEELVRPSGFYRQKARTLLNILAVIARFDDGLDGLLAIDGERLRAWLLTITGVGPETADAILLYAKRHPRFVVDAYTRRFVERHRLTQPGASYDDVQRLFERALPPDAPLYGECHALLVRLGKEHCRPTPRCESCPLERDLRGSEQEREGEDSPV